MNFWLGLLSFFSRRRSSCFDCIEGATVQPVDPKDSRDFLFSQVVRVSDAKRTKVSLARYVGEVKQQGSVGSCGPHALTSAYELELRKKGVDKKFQGSELFLYWTARVRMKATMRDKGIYLREGCKALMDKGMCPEKFWPYDQTKVYVQPPLMPAYWAAKVFAKGVRTKVNGYLRVRTREEAISALDSGHPVVGGFKLYSEFRTKTRNDGIIRLPDDYDVHIGGHAMLIVGYDEDKQMFEVLNSWGRVWGIRGYCWMPYEYFDSAMIDSWVINV